MRKIVLVIACLLALVVVSVAKADPNPPCSLPFTGPLESVLCGKDSKEPNPNKPKPNRSETTTTTTETEPSTTIPVEPKQELPVTG